MVGPLRRVFYWRIMYNRITLVGNVSEIRIVKLGNYDVCKINLLCSREYATRDGQQKSESLYIDVNAWGQLATTTYNTIQKDDQVLVDGQLKLEKWTDSDGKERRKHTVKADSIVKLNEITNNVTNDLPF